ncbi:TonB-dependent receptor [Terriglobus albidus]|uniref:TonB-dependent receptor n=1 Tax=Terriglobus albidus TaxID=1592106 RepID=A0A5B9EK07_9BACT|nr:TonB-dependent receptor [Terriglobus albidus]QEE30661.1 TonB-dependent receptor [Terriglobus albidus]
MRRLLWILLFLIPISAVGQTFRGTLSGNVTDAQGAVLTNVKVVLTNPATGTVLNSTTTGTGDFSFTELPVGKYSLSVSSAGFASKKIDDIDIAVSKTTTLRVELAVGSQDTIVDVAADAIQADTTSSALVAVIDSKSVQEMPMNGRNFTQMVKFVPGASALTTSVNGSRITSINFQVDGADNVDPWLGYVASNQGGIAGIAGGLIPIEAIDQFSMQSGGEADQGRNAGANSNMVIKSGTNNLHGDMFYFDRNEYFAAISPVAAVGSKKPLIRNHQGGFTVGGPIWRDRTFFFIAGEVQIAKANTAIVDTVVSDPWITAATANIAKYTDPTTNAPYAANQLSLNLYKVLYPANTKSAAATANNIIMNNTANYNSFNGILKIDHHFSDAHTLSARYLGTTGKQTAPVTSSYYADYFQTAPMHIHNFSVVDTYTITPHVLNQVTLATNYFLQTFNDANQGFYPQQNAGLNLGLSGIIAAGSPTITMSQFDGVGATQPSGRTDVTGHVTDNLHWTLGRHDMKFGGEFRHSNVNQLYFSSARGTFAFDGTRGPWGGSGTALGALSDFLAGMPSNSSGARLLQGNAQRVWTLNTEDLWAQDNIKLNKRLNLNLGVRYTVPGVINAEADDIYMFVPGSTSGSAPGFNKGYYPNYFSGAAPRVGFSYSPFDNDRTVIRGSYGLFYDFPAMNSWIAGITTNGGAAYAQNNPAGDDAAVIYNQTNVRWAVNVNPFASSTAPQVGAYGVNQNFKMPRSSTVSFNIEQQLSRTTLFTIGYVGTFGRHLEVLYNINQPKVSDLAAGVSLANARPYQQTSFQGMNSKFNQKLLAINQLNFAANSNFHSLQTTIKQAAWKGLITTFNYTWSKSLDYASSNTTPMNSYDLKADYGPSTFDNRHVLNGFAYYTLPKFTDKAKRITQGYQVNALVQFTSGTPINPQYSTNVDGTGELKNRPNWNGVSPYVGGAQLATSSSSGRTYRYLQPASVTFSTPANFTYGNLRRDAFTGPIFHTVDFSLIKRTPVTERVMSEFRAEIFNVFNLNNFANPTVTPTSSSYGLITNTRNASSAPGLGVGEPFNIQFAVKLSF